MKPFLVGLVGAFLVGLVVFRMSPFMRQGVDQPIQFNHQAHKDIECAGCHESVTTQGFAGLPTLDICLTCHETAITKSPEEEKIRVLAREGRPVQWQRLFKQPAHVFYSHRRHVELAKLECRQCHGSIGDSTAPPRRVRNLSMNACISCHEQKKVSAGCVDCHR